MNDILLEIKDLCQWFPVKKKSLFEKQKYVHAVDDVSFSLNYGETIGIVGESGSGKSTLGQCCIRLQNPTKGSIVFEGQDITKIKGKKLRLLREDIQIIFQDPYSSLNPRMKVKDLIAEPLDAQIRLGNFKQSERMNRVYEMMDLVGLNRDYAERYPHEFSGGQRQRIGIARALALKPKLVVCDEAVSALDVSIQAQVVNLLQDIKKKTGVSYLFISHDLSVVKHISNRVLVLYLGEVVELSDKQSIYSNPLHPYTETLLSAVPVPDPENTKEIKIMDGEVPSPINKPIGCCFSTRCPYANELCSSQKPKLEEVEPGRFCACHRAGSRKKEYSML